MGEIAAGALLVWWVMYKLDLWPGISDRRSILRLGQNKQLGENE
jgi:hypothetical protein